MKPQAKQRGSLLLEVVIVVTIAIILAAIAIPNLGELLLRKDMEYSRTTLAQTLHLARQMALSQNTVVDVNIENNQMSITPQNGNHAKTVDFPQRVQLVSASDATNIQFVFRPVGTAGTQQDDLVIDLDEDVRILVKPSNEQITSMQEEIKVGGYGNISVN